MSEAPTDCGFCGQPYHRYATNDPEHEHSAMACVNVLNALVASLTAERDALRNRVSDGGFRTFTVYRTGDLSETHDENQAPISGDVPSFWGVVFPDGTCALRWAGVVAATSVWATFEDAMKVHGHFEPRYGTRIEFHDSAAEVSRLSALVGEAREAVELNYTAVYDLKSDLLSILSKADNA